MKRSLALILLLVVLALPAVAQLPPNVDPLAGIATQGKVFQTAAGIDTLHSTLTKAAGVAATKWRGPIPVYKARNTGDLVLSQYSLPNAWYVYARKPFAYKGLMINGDSTGVYSTAVDTMIANTHNAYSLHTYPVWAIIKAPLRQLRLDPAASDTVYVLPLVLKQ
jgi:hypothetical protein